MLIVKTISKVRKVIAEAKKQGKKIGFVPTMGYFHQGHLSLMESAKKTCDFLVISIYVNPLQFGPKEDFKEYPRDIKRDLKQAKGVGVDLVFVPSDKEMYISGYSTYVEVTGNLTSSLCGAFRPGHFKGVTTVVVKLFDIIEPDKAFFGEKDFQQMQIIKKMTKELNMDIEIIACPTVRERDGIAMSSRNFYLNSEEREQAQTLIKSLNLAKELIKEGERDSQKIKEKMQELIRTKPLAKIDYIAICNPETLEEIKKVNKNTLIALAVRIGKIRLIDNCLIKEG